MSIAEAIGKIDNIVLVVNGGIGRNIMATAVVRSIKKAFPEKDLIVVAGCPDIFLKNPNVKRVLRLGQSLYFYEDYILNSQSYVISVEPYQHHDYIYKQKHFVECWCDLIGIPCDSIYPEIFFNENEKRMAQLFLSKFDRPMVLIQHSGGINPKDKSEKEQLTAQSAMYRRNIPKDIIQRVADILISKGYMIGSVQNENQFCISMAEKIQFPIRAIIALVPEVAGVIAIDSFLQHACAVFKKQSLVLWGGTSPRVLGYDSNVNLTKEACPNPMCHRPNSYLFDIEPTGYMWDCPHNDICMHYDPDYIVEQVEKILPEKEDAHGTGGKAIGGTRISEYTEGNSKPETGEPEETGIGTGEEIPAGTWPACPAGGSGEGCPGNHH